MANPKPVNRPIKFYTTMVKDTHEPGACTRMKWLDYGNRLYPTVDMTKEITTDNFRAEKLIPYSPTSGFVLGQSDTNDIDIYSFTPGATSSLTLKASYDNNVIQDAAYYDNGTDRLIYIIRDGSNFVLDTFNTTTNAYTPGIQDVGAGQLAHLVVHKEYNQLFLTKGNLVYRQDGGTWDGLVFTLPNRIDVYKTIPYRDKLVFFYQTRGGDIYASAWNCDSTNTAFSWTQFIGRGNFVGAETVQGVLMCVVHSADNSNDKEGEGIMYSYSYNGGRFVRKNSIVTPGAQFGDNALQTGIPTIGWANFSDGNYLYAGIGGAAIDQSGIYRFSPNGEINVETYIGDVITSGTFYSANFFGPYLIAGLLNQNGDYELYHRYDDNSTSYDKFTLVSEYITGFLENGYPQKALKEFWVDFELTHGTAEIGRFDLRTSDQDGWSDIGDYDYTVDGALDRIRFTRMKDGSPLPDFKKIQFRLQSFRGLNITGAGYKFIYKDTFEND